MLNFSPGEVLAFDVGPFTHFLIVTDQNTAIFSSLFFGGKVVEQPIATILRGRRFKSIGYPGSLAPKEVIRRARSKIGTPWMPWDNCEHFYNWAHGLEPRSRQWQSALALLVLGGFAVFAARS